MNHGAETPSLLSSVGFSFYLLGCVGCDLPFMKTPSEIRFNWLCRCL